MHHTEVLIVGGGPAGAACAWRLRQRGVDCMILDRQPFPRVKLCAGWITPQVVRDLDLHPADYPGGFTTFGALHISIRGLRFPLPTRQYAIRRWEFDDWLLRRAGVPVHHHKVEVIDQVGDELCRGWRLFRQLPGRRRWDALPGLPHAVPRGTALATAESLIVTLENEFPYPYTDPRCQLWFLEHGLPGYAWYVPKVEPRGTPATSTSASAAELRHCGPGATASSAIGHRDLNNRQVADPRAWFAGE